MTSQLHQIQLTYNAVEDRLILNFSTQDFCEYRFWITRRMMIGLWDVLQKVQNSIFKNELQKKDENKRVEQSIQVEQPQPEAAAYGTPIARYPLGKEPLLLAKFSITPSPRGLIFKLESLQGHALEFSGDLHIITGLCQLIQKTSHQTHWGIS